MKKFELEATGFVQIKVTFLLTIFIRKFKNNNATSNSTHKRPLYVWKLSGYCDATIFLCLVLCSELPTILSASYKIIQY